MLDSEGHEMKVFRFAGRGAASWFGLALLSMAHCRDSVSTSNASSDRAPLANSLGQAAAPASGISPRQPDVAGEQREDDFAVSMYRFASGETLTGVHLHYTTLGTPHRGSHGVVDNAILLLHGTSGRGKAFLAEPFRRAMFGPGEPFDTTKFFVVLPDDIGHGGSSKPSDGRHAHFPHYGYADMVDLEHRLAVEGLGLRHLRIVAGTSMGGMHTWMWAERYPDFMDAAIPIASTPLALRGRNLLWRRIIIEATRNDPGYQGGEYSHPPYGYVSTWPLFSMMVDSTDHLVQMAPDVATATEWLGGPTGAARPPLDANDAVYALDASRDYDPEPEIDRVRVPVLAINFADDQIVGPSLHEAERIFARMNGVTHVVLPASEGTRGHSTLGLADRWSNRVGEFLEHLP